MAQPGRRTNWFAVWVTAAAVVAIGVVAVIVIAMNAATATPGPAPTGAAINTETGAISFGDGPNTVDTYIDFMCPICNDFEQAEGETLQQLTDEGRITLNIHPVAILDRLSQGTEYSTRAASAMYAVAASDPDHAYAFLQAMYANQPSENTSGLTDEQIVGIARDAGVDVTADLEQAITTQEYADFVRAQQLPDGATGTPAVVVNETLIRVTFDPEQDIIANIN